jgi:hypothetical protein
MEDVVKLRPLLTRLLPSLVALPLILGGQPTLASDAGAWSHVGPTTGVLSVAIDPADASLVYAGGPGGVWKSTDGGGTWRQISTTALGHKLGVDPFAANTLYATAPAGPSGGGDQTDSLLRESQDGGATWATVYQVTGTSGAGQSAILDIVADPNRQGALFLALADVNPCCAQVARSLDGGHSWALILPPNIGAGGLITAEASSVAMLTGTAGLLDVGIISYHSGEVMETGNAYATPMPTWASLPAPPPTLTGPSLLALAGDTAHHSLYSVWTLLGVSELARYDNAGAAMSLRGNLPLSTGGQPPQIDAIAINQQQPNWLYAAMTRTPQTQNASQQRGIFATPDAGRTWLALPALDQHIQQLVLAVPTHILYAVTAGGLYRLTITWPVAAPFAGYYQQTDGLRLLGSAISPQMTVNGYPSQYFEKARLEDHSAEHVPANWRFMDGLLVDELQQAGASLPIGGDVSALTYSSLHGLADPGKRVPPPPGYSGGGAMALADGSAFVPFTANLSGAPGHLVAAPFWRYLQRSDLFPGGWLHDVGLPISEAVTVQVTKDLPAGPVQRTITVQAFQRTILTDDPQNPPAWQVERANTGTDYRKAFPARVGP